MPSAIDIAIVWGQTLRVQCVWASRKLNFFDGNPNVQNLSNNESQCSVSMSNGLIACAHSNTHFLTLFRAEWVWDGKQNWTRFNAINFELFLFLLLLFLLLLSLIQLHINFVGWSIPNRWHERVRLRKGAHSQNHEIRFTHRVQNALAKCRPRIRWEIFHQKWHITGVSYGWRVSPIHFNSFGLLIILMKNVQIKQSISTHGVFKKAHPNSISHFFISAYKLRFPNQFPVRHAEVFAVECFSYTCAFELWMPLFYVIDGLWWWIWIGIRLRQHTLLYLSTGKQFSGANNRRISHCPFDRMAHSRNASSTSIHFSFCIKLLLLAVRCAVRVCSFDCWEWLVQNSIKM